MPPDSLSQRLNDEEHTGPGATLILKSRDFNAVMQRRFCVRPSGRRSRSAVFRRQTKRIVCHWLGHQLRGLGSRRCRHDNAFRHRLRRHDEYLALRQGRSARQDRLCGPDSHRDPLTLRDRRHRNRLARLARRRRTLLAAPIAKEAATGRRERTGREQENERLLGQIWTSKVHDITACRSPTS